jgi:hypothetical protein
MAEAGRIFNLACPASPVHYQKAPVDTVLSSVLGAWRLLELAQRSGARLLHTSTSEVYGDPEQHPQREDYWGHVNPNGARSCYDEGKRCAEAMLMAYRQQRAVDACMVRIFNTYGPRLSPGDGRVVSNFIVQALQGDDLTIYGDGQQTRSFCYVDDTLRALLLMMDAAAGRSTAALPGHLTGQVHAGLAARGGPGGWLAAHHPPFPWPAGGAECDGGLTGRPRARLLAHRLKKAPPIALERRGREAAIGRDPFGVGRHRLAVAAVGGVVREREQGNGFIGRSWAAQAGEAHGRPSRRLAWHEEAVVDAAMPADEAHPGACVFRELVQPVGVEFVAHFADELVRGHAWKCLRAPQDIARRWADSRRSERFPEVEPQIPFLRHEACDVVVHGHGWIGFRLKRDVRQLSSERHHAGAVMGVDADMQLGMAVLPCDLLPREDQCRAHAAPPASFLDMQIAQLR